MNKPEAIHVKIETKLEWASPPESREEQWQRTYSQTLVDEKIAPVADALSTLLTELLEGLNI